MEMKTFAQFYPACPLLAQLMKQFPRKVVSEFTPGRSERYALAGATGSLG